MCLWFDHARLGANAPRLGHNDKDETTVLVTVLVSLFELRLICGCALI